MYNISCGRLSGDHMAYNAGDIHRYDIILRPGYRAGNRFVIVVIQ